MNTVLTIVSALGAKQIHTDISNNVSLLSKY